MGYTIPASWNVDTTVPLSKLTPLSNDLTFLGTPPIGFVASASFQSIPSGTVTQVTNMISQYVSGMTWSSSQLTISTAGRYYATGWVGYPAASSAAGYYQSILYHNGTAVSTGSYTTDYVSSLLVPLARFIVICAAGDTLALYTKQNSGSAKNTASRLLVKWISS